MCECCMYQCFVYNRFFFSHDFFAVSDYNIYFVINNVHNNFITTKEFGSYHCKVLYAQQCTAGYTPV